jgi:hypothetical protein
VAADLRYQLNTTLCELKNAAKDQLLGLPFKATSNVDGIMLPGPVKPPLAKSCSICRPGVTGSHPQSERL